MFLGTLRSLIPQSVKAVIRRNMPNLSAKLKDVSDEHVCKPCARETRPCHYHDLFITCSGDVYPCCISRSRGLRIGHISDDDLMSKIVSFEPPYCVCEPYAIRRIVPGDQKTYENLNLELSLACQGRCAMCGVNAPDYTGEYPSSNYNNLTKLIEWALPSNEMLVQGGEILIQPQSLEWLENTKKKWPHLRIALVTNGNVSEAMADRVEKIFYRTTISFVGFQEETYRKIMGMDIRKSVNFAEHLIGRGHISVYLKYLVTSLNVHECNLFLRWALQLAPAMVQIVDSNIDYYINRQTPDDFWNKIFERTGKTIRHELVISDSKYLSERGTRVLIDIPSRSRFGITEEFLNTSGLDKLVSPYELG